ncbi:dTDP-4-dehydrorhamnose 3,5-epimerase [compost metagenome]
MLSNLADFEYKCTDYYDPQDEGCLVWNDPDVGIKWPLADPVLSEKDRVAARLHDLNLKFTHFG